MRVSVCVFVCVLECVCVCVCVCLGCYTIQFGDIWIEILMFLNLRGGS